MRISHLPLLFAHILRYLKRNIYSSTIIIRRTYSLRSSQATVLGHQQQDNCPTERILSNQEIADIVDDAFKVEDQETP